MHAIINKRATYDYEILEKFEAGLILKGYEVKSVKNGQINLNGSYITVKNAEKPQLSLINANIPFYVKANPKIAYDPLRSREILLHKKEINYLTGKIQSGGLTLVPLRVYTTNDLIKLEFGLAIGKKKVDKRETIKKRELDRRLRQGLEY